MGDNDVLIACPDSFAVRAFLNDVARLRHQPLLSGGTSASRGIVCRLRAGEHTLPGLPDRR